MKTVLVLNQDQMGHGTSEVGQRILTTFLQKAIALDGLEAILMYNSGVRLLGPDSSALTELRELENRGVDLVPCGTCVDAFAVDVQVGTVSDMDTIVREMNAAQKVITL